MIQRKRPWLPASGMFLLSFCGFLADGNADDFQWIGPGLGQFNVSGNWSPGGPPGAGDRAFFGSTANSPVSFSNNPTTDGLFIQGADVTFRPVGLPNNALRTYTVSGQSAINQSGILTLTGNGDRRMQMVHQNTTFISGTNNGTLRLQSGGSFLQSSGQLQVGSEGRGTVDISGGSLTTNGVVFVGAGAASSGTVQLSGANSSWISNSLTRIGHRGQGHLLVNGGTVSVQSANGIGSRFGEIAGSTGRATLTGADSQFDNFGLLFIGNSGVGEIKLLDGARLNHTAGGDFVGRASLGVSAGSSGLLEVRGTGSTFSSTGRLDVGEAGSGTVVIGPGGTVAVDVLGIGNQGRVSLEGGTLTLRDVNGNGPIQFDRGTVNVTGGFGNDEWSALGNVVNLDSQRNLSVAGSLSVGNARALGLNGGDLQTNSLTVAGGTIFGSDTLDLPEMVANNRLDARGNVLTSVSGNTNSVIDVDGNLAIGNINSFSGFDFGGSLEVGNRHAVVLDRNRAQLGVSTTLGSGGRLSAPNGFNLGTGESVTATGAATIDGAFTNNGTVNGATADGQFLTFTDDVDGAGSFTGNVLFSDLYAPGNSAAVIDFENFNLDESSLLEIELGGLTAGEFDRLQVSGNAFLNGTLDVALIDSFALDAAQEFLFLDVDGSLTGQFQGLGEGERVGTFGQQELFISYQAGDGNDVSLFTATAVPEPSTYALFALACAAMFVATKRRKQKRGQEPG